MSKIIEFNKAAKDKLKTGLDKVNKAVSVTMGPFGRNVLIEKEYEQLTSTKDGVTVAKSISLEDPIENMGATIIKQAATKTVEGAGDGTTTATVLASSIATQALEATAYATTNVIEIKKGIDEATKEVIEELKRMSKPISDKSQIHQIATLSANGDVEIGNLVSTAMDHAGKEGVITVEKSRSGETSLEIVEGLQFDRGYRSPYFVTNNNNFSCVLNDPYILIYNGRISTIKDLLPLLERVSTENKSLLIIAEDIDGEALGTLVMNKARGVIKVCAVKAPDFGEHRTNALEDIAVLTGGTVLSNEKGLPLSKIDISWLGKARIATINKETTTIVDGKGELEKIQERILSLKTQYDNVKTPYEAQKLQNRIGKMNGGVAIINVGGNNDIEIEEKKDRLDDALQATKAALAEGIVPGAGIALVRARKAITFNNKISNDFRQGKMIVYNACYDPFNQILSNAGEIGANILPKLKTTSVIDVKTMKIVDPYESGIIDPTKVVRLALINAVSAATTLLITECVIYEKQVDKKKEVGLSEFDM